MENFIFKYYCFLIVVISTSMSCTLFTSNQNETNDPVPVLFEILGARSMNWDGDYPCRLNTSNPDMDRGENEPIELIITNRLDFEAYILCDGDMDVPDFDEHFILLGLSTLQSQCVSIKDQNVYLSGDSLVYEVTIGDMACHMPDRAQYIVMIPNDYLMHRVTFIIKKEV